MCKRLAHVCGNIGVRRSIQAAISLSVHFSSNVVFRVSSRLLSGFGVYRVVFYPSPSRFPFDFAACEVQVQWDDGITRALGFTDELVDFGLLEQKLARTDGVGFDVCRGSRQRGNMAADQIKSVLFFQ